jgi:hypothetical protein
MEIKQIGPVNFLYFKAETRLYELPEFIRGVPRALHLEAAKHSLEITGPVYWNYFSFDDCPEFFHLEIAVPIAELPARYDGGFLLKRSNPFKCLSTFHYGSWRNIPATYQKLDAYIHSHQLKKLYSHRQIFIHCDFENPDNNFTELQIGIH